MVCKEASLVNTQDVALTADLLQAWSNDPESARSNLRTIFSGLKADESMSEWAAEALENCGPPLESDLDFLIHLTQDQEDDVGCWACKLIGRLGAKANTFQESLAVVVASEKNGLALRQQAALTLASIGTLTAASREALLAAARSHDPRLARIAIQALESGE